MNDEKKKPEVKKEMVAKEDYLRVAADFENFKKEQVKMQEQMVKFASETVITRILDVMDLVEQALGEAPDAVREETEWFTGMSQVVKEFETALAREGAERIKTTDEPFDPAIMEAVGTVQGGKADTVQSEQRAGWTMHGRVIRPARVIVFQ